MRSTGAATLDVSGETGYMVAGEKVYGLQAERLVQTSIGRMKKVDDEEPM